VMKNWDRDDASMWEARGEIRPYTVSRLMCWVALERTIRIARQRGLPGDILEWSRVRDEIYERIMAKCWNADLQTFTQVEGGTELDAGVLLMPMVKFLSPADPKFLSTLEAVENELVTDTLVFRYTPETSTARRARSRCARSGTSRHSPGRAGSTTRNWRSRRCSPTPIT
jgi:GH15 family glucan-1,4-alpha-glucosidase